jgi:uncharacterized membrane protein YozB (DUF420 family)
MRVEVPMSSAFLRMNLAPILLGAVALAFIAFALPPYLTLDTAKSRIPPPPGVPAYFPLLVAHVVFASVAIATAIVQIVPAIRSRFPASHRRSGRLYVWLGVLPAGLTGLVIGVLTPFGPVLRASNVLLALLWLTCTFAGFRMARAGRYADHRRWMLRSVTLTLSIITNRVWAVIFTLALVPQLDTTFAGNESLMVQTIAGLSGWLGWVLPLLAVEWWLIDGGRRQLTPRLPRRRARNSRSRALPASSIALS